MRQPSTSIASFAERLEHRFYPLLSSRKVWTTEDVEVMFQAALADTLRETLQQLRQAEKDVLTE